MPLDVWAGFKSPSRQYFVTVFLCAPLRRAAATRVCKLIPMCTLLYAARMRESGNWVLGQRRRKVDVLGVDVHLFSNGEEVALSRRDALHVITHKVAVTDRQARAAVSSYTSEGWALPYRALNEPLFVVSSFEHRVLEHAKRRYDANAANGKKGGRPTKQRPAAWDVSSGSVRQVSPSRAAPQPEIPSSSRPSAQAPRAFPSHRNNGRRPRG